MNSSNNVDEFTRKRLEEQHNHVLKHQQKLLQLNLWRSCINCINWSQGPPDNPLNLCRFYNAKPPADVIVNGCSQWEQDIPF